MAPRTWTRGELKRSDRRAQTDPAQSNRRHDRHLPDSNARQRFEREVRIMRKLQHPHLPRIIAGAARVDELPYIAMELLDGETLRDLVSEHPQLPISWVAAVGAQIADGLSAAHIAGVVHRDLKPSNVMLLRGGAVKVLDFGMGRILEDGDAGRLTSTGVTVGTARYMAPEQFRAAAVTRQPTCTPSGACCSNS
ncbi:serine/threonine-protein kinase [Micromonospora sp. BRA006-A]|nr:serine/threonine-protein kinase [Micromonospora sp. BRA006-A]